MLLELATQHQDMIQSQKQEMLKEMQTLEQSLQLEKTKNQILSDESHQLQLSEYNAFCGLFIDTCTFSITRETI